jgi:hypothetical protein
MGPNGGSVAMDSGAQTNFGDLTPYLTYAYTFGYFLKLSSNVWFKFFETKK